MFTDDEIYQTENIPTLLLMAETRINDIRAALGDEHEKNVRDSVHSLHMVVIRISNIVHNW